MFLNSYKKVLVLNVLVFIYFYSHYLFCLFCYRDSLSKRLIQHGVLCCKEVKEFARGVRGRAQWGGAGYGVRGVGWPSRVDAMSPCHWPLRRANSCSHPAPRSLTPLPPHPPTRVYRPPPSLHIALTFAGFTIILFWIWNPHACLAMKSFPDKETFYLFLFVSACYVFGVLFLSLTILWR